MSGREKNGARRCCPISGLEGVTHSLQFYCVSVLKRSALTGTAGVPPVVLANTPLCFPGILE
jgi:hypothetical protein